MKKETVLTISLLTAGKRPELIKCLESLQPLIQTIPSELIIVDTGCDKDNRQLIERYATQVVDFTWCNDFSKARNAGLEKASGEWFLYMDDDEWFEDVSELICFFKTGEYKKYGYAMYIQRNYDDRQGSTYEDAPVGRMIRLEPGVRFIYSIHECFNKGVGKTKYLQCYVHHYGYVYDNQEDKLSHARRNIVPLLKEHKMNPTNLRHVLHLTQEYGCLGDYQKSIDIGEEGVNNFKGGDSEQIFYWNSIVVSNLKGYLLLNQYNMVVEQGEKYLQSKHLNLLSRAYIMVLMAQGFRGCNIDEKVITCVDEYLQIRDNYMINQEPFLDCASSVTANCFTTNILMTAINTGLNAALHIGDWDRILKWCGYIPFDSDRLCLDKTLVVRTTEGLWETKDKDRELCRKVCDTIVVYPQIAEIMRISFENKLNDEDNIVRMEVLKEIIGLPAEEWFWKNDLEIQQSVGNGRTDIWELFFQYADIQFAWVELMRESQEDELPYKESKAFLAALTIDELRTRLTGENYQEIPSLLKKLLEWKPLWTEPIRYCLNDIRGLLTARTNPQVQEKELLAEKIKQQIRILIAQSRKQEAVEILQQLQLMVPEDQEVKELMQEAGMPD